MNFRDRIAAFFGAAPTKKYDAGTSDKGQLSMSDSLRKQQAAVRKMRRGVADVSVSRQRLDLQILDLEKEMGSLRAQETRAASEGDTQAADNASHRFLNVEGELAQLIGRRNALAEQEAMLVAALTGIQSSVAEFHATAETLKDAQTAAKASQNVADALSVVEENQRAPRDGQL